MSHTGIDMWECVNCKETLLGFRAALGHSMETGHRCVGPHGGIKKIYMKEEEEL